MTAYTVSVGHAVTEATVTAMGELTPTPAYEVTPDGRGRPDTWGPSEPCWWWDLTTIIAVES